MFLLGMGGIIGIIIAVLVIVILICWLVSNYNALVKLRNKVKNGFSQIDVQLQRRFDLIPNLVETTKGYAKHEASIWDEFAKARSLYDRAKAGQDVEGLANADKGLSQALGKLMVVSEQYPELKANSNFQEVMRQLNDTENKIAYARQFYNDIVQKYNDKTELFPSNIVAGMFNFEQSKFFEVTNEEARQGVKVQF